MMIRFSFLYKDTTITGLDTCMAYGRSSEYYIFFSEDTAGALIVL